MEEPPKFDVIKIMQMMQQMHKIAPVIQTVSTNIEGATINDQTYIDDAFTRFTTFFF